MGEGRRGGDAFGEIGRERLAKYPKRGELGLFCPSFALKDFDFVWLHKIHQCYLKSEKNPS